MYSDTEIEGEVDLVDLFNNPAVSYRGTEEDRQEARDLLASDMSSIIAGYNQYPVKNHLVALDRELNSITCF